MRVIKGQLKLQYEFLCIHEMLEFKPASLDAAAEVAGYAALDLEQKRVVRFFRVFDDMMIEIKRISKDTHAGGVLMAA